MSIEQTKLIQMYRKKFPNESFRKMSKRTGIQISRLFRVFNGQEMRISEFLKIQEFVCDQSEFMPTVNSDEQIWNWIKSHWSGLALSRKLHVQNLIQHYVDEMKDYYRYENETIEQEEKFSYEA